MKVEDSRGKITVKWQRLLTDGETCNRCRSTGEEVEEAVERLKGLLPKLGIEVELEKEKLTEEEFLENPKTSNRIFINDEALEDLIGADVGGSECCDVCGEEECRTVIIDGEEHEVVPSQTIVNAAVRLANDLFSDSGCCSTSVGKNSCC